MLAKLHPRVPIEYHTVQTDGDQLADAPLADAGGKGLFTRAVEQALLDKKTDIAVHSLKDIPATDALNLNKRRLVTAAIPRRADHRDCLITHDPNADNIDNLPKGAIIGTASPRRAAQIKHLRPDVEVRLLRGNVDTRLNKVLQDKQVTATFLAVAGLQRLGLGEHTGRPIDADTMLPAAGQGALAVQCRLDDHASMIRCLPINHGPTAAAVTAEQQVVAALNGDCHSPIAALAEPINDNGTLRFRLRAQVLSPDGTQSILADAQGDAQKLAQLVNHVLDQLNTQGAQDLLTRPTPADAAR